MSNRINHCIRFEVGKDNIKNDDFNVWCSENIKSKYDSNIHMAKETLYRNGRWGMYYFLTYDLIFYDEDDYTLFKMVWG